MKNKWTKDGDTHRLQITDDIGFTVDLSRDEVAVLLSDLCHNVYPTPKHPCPEAESQRCGLCEPHLKSGPDIRKVVDEQYAEMHARMPDAPVIKTIRS